MDELFDLPAAASIPEREVRRGAPRVQRPNRAQLELRTVDLDGLLPSDHRARLVWEFVEGLDLGPLYARIRATTDGPGRPPIDPAILTALWLYATLENVGSARALERLCDAHDAYRWIAGGVPVNHHTLADFRVDHGELFDRLLTASVTALAAEGLVTLARVAQDGVRVRAAAGRQSYRRGDRLAELERDAAGHVAALRDELEADPGASNRRLAAARERAARERAERVRAALAKLPELEAQKARRTYRGRKDAPPVASVTDPEARFMRMPDGGVRPAFNVQFATATTEQVIVGLDVVAITDGDQLRPMADQLASRYGPVVAEHLADGGYVNRGHLDHLASCGTTAYLPVGKPRRGTVRDPHLPRPRDSAAVAAWRVRMGTPEAKEIYRERAATAECVNAIARNRGLTAFRVRGLERARAVVLWFALAHNLLRAVALRAARLAQPALATVPV
jgi:transposase